jgi:hypothetical protein
MDWDEDAVGEAKEACHVMGDAGTAIGERDDVARATLSVGCAVRHPGIERHRIHMRSLRRRDPPLLDSKLAP